MALADTYIFPKDISSIPYPPKALPWAVPAKKDIVSKMSVAFKQKFPEIVNTKNYAQLAEQVVEVPNEFDELRLQGLSSNLGIVSLYVKGKVIVYMLPMNLARLHSMLGINTLVNNSLKGNLRLEILQTGVDIYNLDHRFDAARYRHRQSKHKLAAGDEMLHISGKTGIYLGVAKSYQVVPHTLTYQFQTIVVKTDDGYVIERFSEIPETWVSTGTNRLPTYDETYYYQLSSGYAIGQQMVLATEAVPYAGIQSLNSQDTVILQTETQRYLLRRGSKVCIQLTPNFQFKHIWEQNTEVNFDDIGEVLTVQKPYILHPNTHQPCYL